RQPGVEREAPFGIRGQVAAFGFERRRFGHYGSRYVLRYDRASSSTTAERMWLFAATALILSVSPARTRHARRVPASITTASAPSLPDNRPPPSSLTSKSHPGSVALASSRCSARSRAKIVVRPLSVARHEGLSPASRKDAQS